MSKSEKNFCCSDLVPWIPTFFAILENNVIANFTYSKACFDKGRRKVIPVSYFNYLNCTRRSSTVTQSNRFFTIFVFLSREQIKRIKIANRKNISRCINRILINLLTYAPRLFCCALALCILVYKTIGLFDLTSIPIKTVAN